MLHNVTCSYMQSQIRWIHVVLEEELNESVIITFTLIALSRCS